MYNFYDWRSGLKLPQVVVECTSLELHIQLFVEFLALNMKLEGGGSPAMFIRKYELRELKTTNIYFQ